MSHADTPPQLPNVTDEAGDTPGWVPIFGVLLFAALVACVWWGHHQHEAVEAGATPAPTQAK